MSGGSYDYLCYKETDDWLAGVPERAQQMGDRLAELGYPDAALETATAILAARAARVRMEAILRRMQPVWKAVEWMDSGDWGPDDLAAAVAEYRGEQ